MGPCVPGSLCPQGFLSLQGSLCPERTSAVSLAVPAVLRWPSGVLCPTLGVPIPLVIPVSQGSPRIPAPHLLPPKAPSSSSFYSLAPLINHSQCNFSTFHPKTAQVHPKSHSFHLTLLLPASAPPHWFSLDRIFQLFFPPVTSQCAFGGDPWPLSSLWCVPQLTGFHYRAQGGF